MPSDNATDLSALLMKIQGQRDEQACNDLWDTVYQQLAAMARQRLATQNRRMADEEDVALSTVKSFVRAAEQGRLSAIQNRDELWRVLITIMARKTNALRQQLDTEKRGNGAVRGDSVFATTSQNRSAGFDQMAHPAHPEQLVEDLIGECRERIEALPDESLRQIALKKMEGYEVTEIAIQLGLATATIKRKLARIRILWADDDPRR
jgi:DNA-directed RNA polymerase specialized sigma24 family protein